jgi:hypothetical protein
MCNHVYQKFINAAALNLNGVAIAAAKTSDAFDVEGFNQMTIAVVHTYNAATTISLYLTYSEDGTNYCRMKTIDSIAAGTITISDATYSDATGGAADNFYLDIPINYKYMKITISCDGAGTDTAVVTVRLGAK